MRSGLTRHSADAQQHVGGEPLGEQDGENKQKPARPSEKKLNWKCDGGRQRETSPVSRRNPLTDASKREDRPVGYIVIQVYLRPHGRITFLVE